MAVDAQAWSKCFVVVVGFALSPINHFPHSPLGQPLVVSLLVCFCFLCVFFLRHHFLCNICNFRHEKGNGTEISPTIVSGIVGM